MSTPVRIKFGHLLPMAGDEIDDGELIVQDGTVREISVRSVEPFAGKTIDLSDCLVMPGFVNAHCHLTLSALSGKVERREKFTDWAAALVAQNATIPWGERVDALHAGAEEMLRSGVCQLGDYLSYPELISDYAALPFRQVLYLEVLGFDPAARDAVLQTLQPILEEHLNVGARFRLGLAPHAPYSVSPQLFAGLKALAKRYDCPLSCHVAEFEEETRFLNEGGGELETFLRSRNVFWEGWKPPGMSPTAYLDGMGALDSLAAVHLNHIDDADIDLLAERGTHAVFCPASTHWFGRRQWIPVRKLLDRGVGVGLGTDSLASNESLNFLHELRVAETMLPDVSREEILRMATVGGAKALGLTSGTLAPGQRADLIAFRYERPPERWADLPFDPARDAVDFSMIAGRRTAGPN